MGIKFTDEAQAVWDNLPEDTRKEWEAEHKCQQCGGDFPSDEMNGSIHDGQLAFYRQCPVCAHKEVRLLDFNKERQQAIDDDFEQWKKRKQASNPDMF